MLHRACLMAALLVGSAPALAAEVLPAAQDDSLTAQLERERHALFDAVADGVVFINCGDQMFGSGFFVSASGLIATNRHVVECDDRITVILRSGEKKKAKIASRDAQYDLALLRIKLGSKTVKVLPLGNSDDVRVGDYAAAVGHPVGGVWTFNEGLISNRYPARNDQYAGIIQTQVPLQPGSSGGPVFNRHGQVVCVHTAGLKNGGVTGFCIQSNLVKRLLVEHEGVSNAQLAVNGSIAEAELLVDGAPSGTVPALLTLPPGEHRVEIRARGRRLTRTITLEKGRVSQLFVKVEDLE